jgi:hypothetical protein
LVSGAVVDSPPSELVVWTVPEFGTPDDVATGLTAALAAYQLANPDTTIVTELKPSRGPTGIVAYLESTSKVVPDQMPDLAIVPLESVTSGIASGWLRQMPGSVADDRIDDAFEFARGLSSREDGRWAVPLAVDVVHAVAAGRPPPSTWSEILNGTTFAVPEPGGDAPGLATPLTFYASAGGDIAALPTGDQDAAGDTRAFYESGASQGNLVITEGGTSPRDSWNEFLSSELDSGAVSGGILAHQQANFPGLEWAAMPGRDGPAPPVGWGWAIAYTGNDPGKAELTGQLIGWLTHPDYRSWVASAGSLPAWSNGFVETTLDGIDPPPSADYLEFLSSLLQVAVTADQSDYWGADWANTVGRALDGESAEASVSALSP